MNLIERAESMFPVARNDRIRNLLFLSGMSILVFIETMKTTLFPESLAFYRVIKTVALVLVALKLVLFDTWRLKSALACALSFAVALLVRYSSTCYTEPFFWTLLLWGARDIDFRRILKVHFALVLLIVAAAFVSSLAGWIPYLRFTSEHGVRNSFGIGYPTDFAAYLFFLTATLCYLMKDRMKSWMYAFVIAFGILILRCCHTRLDSLCITGLGFMLMIEKILEPRLRGRMVALRWLLCFSPVILFLLVFVLSLEYDSSAFWMYRLNGLFSNRLALGHDAFRRYSVNLFGQYIQMHGLGGSPEGVADYFFIDSSYLYILFQYGIVFTVMVLGVFVISSAERMDDSVFLIVLLLVAVNASTAHHLTHIQYNPFFMALFASFKNTSSPLPQRGEGDRLNP